MNECIFHFKLIRGQETKQLRALIMLPKDREPAVEDFMEAFRKLGYRVMLENLSELIFAPESGSEDYKLDVTHIEIKGEDGDVLQHDGELKSILSHLISVK